MDAGHMESFQDQGMMTSEVMLDEKQNTAEAFFLTFMSIQYLVHDFTKILTYIKIQMPKLICFRILSRSRDGAELGSK
jgi:hypothetical protein